MGKRIIGYYRLALLLLLPVILASCSNVKSYRSDIEKNFRIEPKISSGFDARLDIFDVDSKCEIDYAGSVQLDHGSVEIGLPVNRPVYMELMLFKPASLFRSASATTYPILFLHPRLGQKYVAQVSYLDNFYKFRLREGGRVIEIKSLETCQKAEIIKGSTGSRKHGVGSSYVARLPLFTSSKIKACYCLMTAALHSALLFQR